MLEEIFEFLYLGQIAALENNNGDIDKKEYNVWMFLLTWCASWLQVYATARVRALSSLTLVPRALAPAVRACGQHNLTQPAVRRLGRAVTQL